MVVVALFVLIVAIIALIFRALRRRPLKRWGLVALASLILIIVFSGISSVLYPASQREQAPPLPELAEEEESATSEATPETTSETTPETASEVASAPSEPDEEDAREGDTGSESSGYDETVTVTRVVDGDTIRIRPAVNGYDEVRLIGVDTPETRDPDCEVQPYGQQASTFTTSQLQGEEVDLEFDEERVDRYDRLLAYVYKDEEMFNETLLEEGYAQVATFPPNVKYVERFEEAQAEAQAAQRGIWALSAEQQSELTDRGNGVGGSGCTPKATPPPKAPPEPAPTPDVPTPDVPSAPAVPTPSSSGADCSAGVKNVPVIPGSKGDRDKDGIACET
jgi:micrococcal nuclease